MPNPVYYQIARREPTMVMQLRLADIAGATQAYDSGARNSLNGFYNGSPAVGPALIQGDSTAASRLLGGGQNVQVPDIAQLRLTTAFTLEAWVAPTTASQTVKIISKAGVSGTFAGPYAIGLSSGNLIASVGNGSSAVFCSGPTIPIGSPSRIAAVVFRGRLSVFLNDVLVNSVAIGGQTVSDAGQAFFVGGSYVGLVGEVAVYNGALSLLRHTRHFAAGQAIITDPAHFVSVDPPVYT